MIKGAIFDLDGTLCDTIGSLAYCGNLALEGVGLKGRPEEEYNYFAGDGARNIVKRALAAAGDTEGKLFPEAFAIYSQVFQEGCVHGVVAYPGMKEVLSILRERGIMLAVLSNKQHPQTIKVIETVFGKGFFHRIQGQQDAIPKKPDPTACFSICQAFGCQPEEMMYVGDTNTDMKTGQNAGMFTIGVLWGFRPREELEACNPDALVEEPGMLEKFCRG